VAQPARWELPLEWRSLVAAAALGTIIAGCASLPPPRERVASTALLDTAETRLGRAVAADMAANPGKSAVVQA